MDISMCSGEECPLRETCYRYTAEANDHRQFWFSVAPFKEGTCKYYWHRCKHIHREGESCQLNNNCKYPDCNEDGPIKPIHKFNDGIGATLCHHCRVIIAECFMQDLFCEECFTKRKEALSKLKQVK